MRPTAQLRYRALATLFAQKLTLCDGDLSTLVISLTNEQFKEPGKHYHRQCIYPDFRTRFPFGPEPIIPVPIRNTQHGC